MLFKHLLFISLFSLSLTQILDESISSIIGDAYGVLKLLVLPNGDLVSAGCEDIKIWDITTGKLKKSLKSHWWCVSSMKLLPNGDLASSSDDTTVKIWDINTGIPKFTMTSHTFGVRTSSKINNLKPL